MRAGVCPHAASSPGAQAIEKQVSWASVYRHALNPEVYLDADNVGALAHALAKLPEHDRPGGLDALLAETRQWTLEQGARYAELMERAGGEARAVARAILIGSSPLASVLGCWLQGVSAPGVFENDVQLQLLSLLADDVGVGMPGASRADQFKLLLGRFDAQLYAGSAADLSFQPALDDASFGLPAVLLAMSRRSDHFGPQLCAIDLVMRSVGMLPCWAAIRAGHPDWIDWSRLDLSSAREAAIVADPLALSQAVVARVTAAGPAAERQVAQAARWMLGALRQLDALIFQQAGAVLDPHVQMARLIRERARDASVYHQSYELGGCPLAQHFKEAMNDPAPLMALVAGSRLVRPGVAAKSLLVNGMVSPQGKMFRVFRKHELATIRSWIDALPGAAPQPAPAPLRPAGGGGTIAASGDMAIGRRPRDIRDAYYVLQGRALAPRTRQFALDYADYWMRHAAGTRDTPQSLPPAWPQAGLRPWLSDQHSRTGQTFQDNPDAAIPAREEIIDSTLQLAPLICIDGAWLQGFTDVQLASSKLGHSLFEIYWDELGNGRLELNHPKIYRDLLRQMDIELAPTGSPAFACDSRLREESFRLPVLWLCLGKLSLTFLPEILGMNLAMELSGVGGGYRFANRFLKHYRFSTHFVDLHNTIDNVGTGHSAWAADAVDEHMRTLAATADAKALARQWQRVRAGYKSMTAVPPRVDEWLANLYASRSERGAPADPKNDVLLHHSWLNTASI